MPLPPESMCNTNTPADDKASPGVIPNSWCNPPGLARQHEWVSGALVCQNKRGAFLFLTLLTVCVCVHAGQCLLHYTRMDYSWWCPPSRRVKKNCCEMTPLSFSPLSHTHTILQGTSTSWLRNVFLAQPSSQGEIVCARACVWVCVCVCAGSGETACRIPMSWKTISHVLAGWGDKVNSGLAQREHDNLFLHQAESSTSHTPLAIS